MACGCKTFQHFDQTAATRLARLFIGRIPCDKTKHDIFMEVCRVTEEVKDVTVYNKINDKTQNRSYAFIEYQSHKAAAIARRVLGVSRLWGSYVIVDWAEPEPDVPEEELAHVKCLFVRNFSSYTTPNSLMEEFTRAMENPQGIKSVKIVRDFAFVDFYNRDDALQAATVMNGRLVNGFNLEVELAKPRTENNFKALQQQHSRPLIGTLPPTNTRRPMYCLDLLAQVQQSGARRRPFEQQQFLEPGLVCDPRQVVTYWRRRLPDLSFISFLTDVCMTEGWGNPDYFLKEFKQKVRHRKIKMYAYKVIIRGLSDLQTEFAFNPVQFVEDRSMAKEYAAIYALSKIRLTSIQGKPKKKYTDSHITPEDFAKFMTFMKSMQPFGLHPAMSGIMAGIDRELAQAYSLLSLSDSGQGQTVQNFAHQAVQAPNVPSEMLPAGFSLPQDAQVPIYGGIGGYENLAINQAAQMPIPVFPGVQTSFDMTAVNQLGFVNANFQSSVSDISNFTMSSASAESSSALSSEQSTQT